MQIADIYAQFRGDSQQLIADAKKGGGEAGTAAGKTFGDHLRRGLKVAAVGAGLVGAALAGQQLKLNAAMAAFRAETGATAEEAEQAGKAINAMSGRNLQGIEEIGEALTKVHTDLGLTGEEAEATTERFLRFAQATGQDAAAAVLDFDDILDAWNLTAADAQGIMDQLVVSHQEYGGSIEENQATLAKLAPALQAANLTIDDGIGLLNLFAASGVDSTAAVAGMTKALTTVKSPQELQRLIDDIATTEDDFARADKAAKLFGARAGAKLANALEGADLDDYKVSLDEAAGATDRARDASITFADQLALGLKGAIATATEVLGPAGPLLLGISSLATLLGPALAGVWNKLGGSAVVRLAIGAAGAAAGLAYQGAAFVASTFISGATALWALAGGPKVIAAAAAAGASAGAAYVSGFATAVAQKVFVPLALEATTQDAFRLETMPDGSVRFGDGTVLWEGPKALSGFGTDVFQRIGIGVTTASLAMGTAFQRIGGGAAAAVAPVAALSGNVGGLTNDVAGLVGPFQTVGGAIAAFVKRSVAATQEVFDLAAAVDLAKGSFKSFWQSVREDQRRVRFFARNPDKFREEMQKLEGTMRGAQKRLDQLTKDGVTRREAFEVESLRRLIAKLQGQRQSYIAVAKTNGAAYGNALETSMERAFDPRLPPPPPGPPPPPPRGRRHHYTGPMEGGVPWLIGERRHEQAFLPPPGRGYMWDAADTREMQAGGGDTYNIPLTVEGLPMRAETPLEVVQQFRRMARMGILTPRRRSAWSTG